MAIRMRVAYNQMGKNTFDVPIEYNNINTDFYSDVAFDNNLSFASFSNSFSQKDLISLREKLGYVEIPTEFHYKLFQKNDFRIDAISGLGVFFLKKNQISAIKNSGAIVNLKANSRNSLISAGIHLGFDLNYQINKAYKIQLEPLFIPQIGLYQQPIGDNSFLLRLQISLRYKL